jgi:L-serine/L-threonine ammonia-lyase
MNYAKSGVETGDGEKLQNCCGLARCVEVRSYIQQKVRIVTSRMASKTAVASVSKAAKEAFQLGYFVKTPVISVTRNVKGIGTVNVHYKLESEQPSGSFKDRGLSTMVQAAKSKGPVSKIITSSGGNAGYAATTVGQKMKVPVSVFCPVTTPAFMQQKLKDRGATVHVGGANWNEADAFARVALAADTSSFYVPPFDHPDIWDGHSTIVDELQETLGNDGKPDIIISSVGGGGLLHGLQLGMQRFGWDKSVGLIAAETDGSASYAHSKKLGYTEAIKEIKTIATSLGTLKVIDQSIRSPVHTMPVVVSDKLAALSCMEFYDAHKKLVEAACGTALAVLHESVIPSWYDELAHWKRSRNDLTFGKRPLNAVVIVCGGSVVTPELLVKWKNDFGL